MKEACGAVPFPGCHVSLHTPPSLQSSFLPLIKPPHVRAQGSREICSLRPCRGIWAGRAKYQNQEPAHVMGPTPCPSSNPTGPHSPRQAAGWDLCPGLRAEGRSQGGTLGAQLPLLPLHSVPGCSQPALPWHRKQSQSISRRKGPGTRRTFEQAGKSLEAAAGMCPREAANTAPK